MTPLEAALAWQAAGVSVVPARNDGTKAPLGVWKQYQHTVADTEQLHTWFDGGHPGIGVICGTVSGGLEMLELEGRAVDLVTDLAQLMTDNGLAALWGRLNTGYLEQSPSGGLHWFYRVIDGPARPNTKLARRQTAGVIEVLAETRGEGGFVVVAPSAGTVHPTGLPWLAIAGGPTAVPYITVDERDQLHAIVNLLDTMPTPSPVTAARLASVPGGRPGDDYNTRTTWADILTPHGWQAVWKLNSGGIGWRRPGKTVGISATTGRNDGDNLYVFTTSTEFEAERPYSKFAAYALLEHGGDYSAAAKQLRRDGYGTNPTPPPTTPTAAAPVPTADTTDEQDPEPLEATWEPVDLTAILDGTYTPETPTLMPRTDGICLLYPGRVHSMHGESESGKSLVIQAEAARTLTTGGTVLYVDFESDAPAVVGRLIELGVDAFTIAQRFHYTHPEADPAGPLHERVAYHQLLDQDYDLAVVDGVTDALGIFGASSKDNDDVATFMRAIPRTIARRTGAAVVVIDHVTKDPDSRGRFAIGGQAKMAALDGAAYVVDVAEPLGRGLRGVINLRIAKDRPGSIRPHAGAFHKTDRTQLAAQVIIDSTHGTIDVTVAKPTNLITDSDHGRGQWKPTHYMERVSRLLEVSPEPLSTNVIEDAITGKRDHIRTALEHLVTGGWAALSVGPRNAKLHASLRPYREAEDPDADAYIPTDLAPRPDLAPTSPGRGASDFAPEPPLPYGKGVGGARSAVTPGEHDLAPEIHATKCRDCNASITFQTARSNAGRCGSCALNATSPA